MSIVCLSSNGQRPEMFTNIFPQSIVLNPGAAVSVMGYSGNILGGTADEIYNISVVAGVNDCLVIYHGNVTNAPAGIPNDNFMPQQVYVPEGNYTPVAFATALENALNDYEYVDTFQGGWAVTWNTPPAVPPPAHNTFTIQCARGRSPDADQGRWIVYNGQNFAGSINVAGTETELDPHNVGPPVETNFAFLDLQPSYIGYTDELSGSPYTTHGYELQIDYTGNPLDTALSFGLCTENSLTKCRRNLINTELSGTNYFGPSRRADLIYESTKAANGKLDFAIKNSGSELVGAFAIGINIAPNGDIGLISSLCSSTESGAFKTRQIIDYSSGLSISDGGGAGTTKHFAMAPRWDVATDTCCMEFFYDNGGGGGLVPIDIYALHRDDALWKVSNKVHMGVVYNPDSIAVSSEIARVTGMHESWIGGPVDPVQDTTIGWEPVKPSDYASLAAPLQRNQWINACNKANMRQLAGWHTQASLSILAAHTVGWTSPEPLTSGLSESLTALSPILITCPDLSGVAGYVGAAAGGGVEAPLLAVARIRGNTTEFGFSADLGDDWIEINNPGELVITQLTIVLKDVTNRLYTQLEPNFVVWLKFRNSAKLEYNKEDVTVGRFSHAILK